MKILNKTKIIAYSIAAILMTLASDSALATQYILQNILQITGAGLEPAIFLYMEGGLELEISHSSTNTNINMPGTYSGSRKLVTLHHVHFKKSPAFELFYKNVRSAAITPTIHIIFYNLNGSNNIYTLYSAHTIFMTTPVDLGTGYYMVDHMQIEFQQAVHSND